MTKKTLQTLKTELAALLGFVLIVWGVAKWCMPAAMITAGILAIWIARANVPSDEDRG